MIYTDFEGLKLSQLSLGCMRLPVIDGDNTRIDIEQTREMVAYAMEHGVNYYDTAWGYHGGTSEPVMGEILKDYPRDSFYIASKFPGYDSNNFGKHEEIFNQQLERLQTDYIDFYLFHNIAESNIDLYLDPSYGTKEFFMRIKAEGKIKHLGFSIHGSQEIFTRFLEAYDECIEFCQIQLNWMDWDFQHAKNKIALCRTMAMPVMVMEPLRGGKLCNLPEDAVAKLKDLRPNETVPGWSFRWLQSIPEVAVVLSGMSSFDQLKENIATFETNEPLNNEEIDALYEISKAMMPRKVLACTGCNYCLKYCPKFLNIPKFIELYNEEMVSGYTFEAPMYVKSLPFERQPQNCAHCKQCETICPQKLPIAKMMIDLSVRIIRNPNKK